MAETAKQHLKELLHSFDTAMLITRHGDKEHARPMAIAAVDEASTLWFVTANDVPKAEEIRRDPRVAVTFQSRTRYVALSGHAELVTDRAKVHELYKPDWRVWFPRGKDDPQLALIRVAVTDAEFWDNAGAKGVRYVFQAVKALLSKEAPAPTAGLHDRVKSKDDGPISRPH